MPLDSLQQAVVEALDAHGQPPHARLPEHGHIAVRQVVRVRLHGHLADGEEPLCKRQRLGQLVDKDRRRPSPHVEGLKIVPRVAIELHLAPQGPEIGPRHVLVEDDAVKGAVGAELLAKGHVHVEHERHAARPRGHRQIFGGGKAHVLGVFLPHVARDEPLDQHGDTIIPHSARPSPQATHWPPDMMGYPRWPSMCHALIE